MRYYTQKDGLQNTLLAVAGVSVVLKIKRWEPQHNFL